MSLPKKTPVGRTRDAGWQIGARRTFNVRIEDAWNWLTSSEGARAWLGEPQNLSFIKGEEYFLVDGSQGEVRVFKPNSHLRITYQPGYWPRASTIQVRVLDRKERTSIVFHEENLPNAEARQERRQHYFRALDIAGEWVKARSGGEK